jgi:hypothetical protein
MSIENTVEKVIAEMDANVKIILMADGKFYIRHSDGGFLGRRTPFCPPVTFHKFDKHLRWKSRYFFMAKMKRLAVVKYLTELALSDIEVCEK